MQPNQHPQNNFSIGALASTTYQPYNAQSSYIPQFPPMSSIQPPTSHLSPPQQPAIPPIQQIQHQAMQQHHSIQQPSAHPLSQSSHPLPLQQPSPHPLLSQPKRQTKPNQKYQDAIQQQTVQQPQEFVPKMDFHQLPKLALEKYAQKNGISQDAESATVLFQNSVIDEKESIAFFIYSVQNKEKVLKLTSDYLTKK